eukprot:TRINITY_DN20711_c0_g1_i1.p1 TRINITY_DN20711_c0_g1~~TRINITY_DN20711_c0_g1_i1.p1  ORF type:complete len:171 (-),score=17.86 TRINITY_DN20711_c0_g1_i1:15-527(-)
MYGCVLGRFAARRMISVQRQVGKIKVARICGGNRKNLRLSFYLGSRYWLSTGTAFAKDVDGIGKGAEDCPRVVHDDVNSRFVARFTDGEEALVEYRKDAPKLWTYYHTYTPKSKRGLGITERVADAAFQYAQKEGIKWNLTCCYLSGPFFKKHPQYSAKKDLAKGTVFKI